MNFLAHLVLSCHDPAMQMGNLLGDFVKGRPPDHFPEGIRQGIFLHRRIDRATDQHPAVRKLLPLLRPRHGRYAGVVADVLFDYYLHRDWSQRVLISYDDFSAQTYATIRRYVPLLDQRLQKRFTDMVEHRWLEVYRTLPGILSVFERMRPRMSRPELMDDMALTLEEHDEQLAHTFDLLFPDLRHIVNEFCGCT